MILDNEYRLKALEELDAISYDEFDRLVANYEDTRGGMERYLKKTGSLKEATTYDKYKAMLQSVQQTKDIRRRLLILEQIREEHMGAKK